MGVAFNQIFNAAKNHFHEQRLRASPATPESAKCAGENKNAGDEQQHGDGKDGRILWPKNLAENGKSPLDDVEEEQGIALNPHKWASE